MELPNPLNSSPRARVSCTNCALRRLCLPPELSEAELESAEHLVSTRLRVRRGTALYRTGDAFKSLYAVWVGSLKSTLTSNDGREQVTGFHMTGEMLGFDGVGAGAHTCDAVALEDAEVCVIPYNRIEENVATLPFMRRHLYSQMSREIVRKHGLMLMLGSMQAGERLATFLLELSERFETRGYSSKEFILRMSRAELGSYLGITLETVSRLLSQFGRMGLIDVQHVRGVRIADRDGLRRLAAGRETERHDGHCAQVRAIPLRAPAQRQAATAPELEEEYA